ncbi:Uncharacterised protein [Mycobacteroides abscessus subsp. abscessus]|nr:Uncharacterised protein [Mycobacteroides abscessus subsp. abscessus]
MSLAAAPRGTAADTLAVAGTAPDGAGIDAPTDSCVGVEHAAVTAHTRASAETVRARTGDGRSRVVAT